ncbi:hypothetical protein MT881_002761, partial [Enterococcus faecium]|nr:hypothetical protein [Enterococcus faecium]
KKIEDTTGLENCVNLKELNLYDNDLRNLDGIKNLENLTYLHIGTKDEKGERKQVNLTNEEISKLNLPKLKTLVMQGNRNITDLSFTSNLPELTALYVKATGCIDLTTVSSHVTTVYSNNQFVTEDKQSIVGDTLTLKVKEIKNRDGSTPTITPNNEGVYDAEKGTITWTGLTKETTSLSYGWAGKDTFSGTVTVPVEVKEDKVVNVPDENLRKELKKALGVTEDKELTQTKLASLTSFWATD